MSAPPELRTRPAAASRRAQPLSIADKLELGYERMRSQARACLRADPALRALAREEHDEVFHDAWLELWAQRERRTFRDLERQFPTIVRNKARKRLDRDRRHPALSLEQRSEQGGGELGVADPDAAVPERVERRWEANLVAELVDSLPERQRRLITYRWALGLKPDEIRRRLGLPTLKRYEHELAEAGRRVFELASGAREGGWCERRRSLLKCYALGLASERQREQARRHLGNCPGCRTLVLEVRGLVRDVAAVLPIPPEPTLHGRAWEALGELGSSLRERLGELTVSVKQQLQALGARLGDAGAASTAEVASGGVLGGAGAAKVVLTVCLGGAAVGGAAVCIDRGVFPADMTRFVEIERRRPERAKPSRPESRARPQRTSAAATAPAQPTIRPSRTVAPRQLRATLAGHRSRLAGWGRRRAHARQHPGSVPLWAELGRRGGHRQLRRRTARRRGGDPARRRRPGRVRDALRRRGLRLVGDVGVDRVYGAAVTVSDVWAPAVRATGGSIDAGGVQRGPASVAYAASDNVGIRSSRLAIDGAVRTASEQSYACDYTRAPCRARTRGP